MIRSVLSSGRAWPLLVLLAVAFFQWWALPSATPQGKDTNLYIEGARSLAEGAGYRHVIHVGGPPLRLYPPGQSIFLALPWKLGGGQFPENYRAMAMAEWAAAMAAVVALLAYLRGQGHGPLALSFAAAVLGLSPMWTSYLHFLWSEAVFCALAFALFTQLRSAVETAEMRRWLMVGLLLAAMLLWRKAALAFIAGAGVAALLHGGERRWKGLFLAVVPAVGMAAVVALATRDPGDWSGGSYARSWQDQWQRLGGTPGYLAIVGRHLAELVTGGSFVDALFATFPRLASKEAMLDPVWAGWLGNLGAVVGAAIALLCAFGLADDRTPAGRATAWIAALVTLQSVLWIWDTGGRFYLPLVAPIMAWSARGGRLLAGPGHWRWLRPALAVALVPLVAANGVYAARFAGYADQRSAEVRAFARSVAPAGLRDGDMAVDIELPAMLVQRETGVKIADIPFADEHAGIWVPMRPGAASVPRWYLARTKLFDGAGTITTIHGIYRIEQRSPDGSLCLARHEAKP